MADKVVYAQSWYDGAIKWFAIASAVASPMSFYIDAPFGRFTPGEASAYLVDGIKSWIIMELVSPIMFMCTYLASPLSASASPTPQLLITPANLLASLFVIHYFNRALVSPLRTPSRSKSHIMVPINAVAYNLVNGSLMGTYLSSPAATAFLDGAFQHPAFWLAVTTWALGLAGNILHDEILLNLRRNAKAKGKARAEKDNAAVSEKPKGEHYAVPHGWLYTYISYPNYTCEWVEWAAFAYAAAPMPAFAGLVTMVPSLASFGAFGKTLTPPWAFVISEVLVMFPRAWRGHQWYLRRFPDYPRGRKVVLPFIL